MIPWRELGRTKTPDDSLLTLSEHDGSFSIRIDGYELMSSRQHGSEEAMADIGCKAIANAKQPAVLVGGLGLGYTLRATLDRLPPEAQVTIAELIPSVVEWNRDVLAPLADRPLEDSRVNVFTGDVGDLLKRSRKAFDVILLDVDNGPTAMTSADNSWLYKVAGLSATHQALRPGGVVVVWSAGPDKSFEERMRTVGFTLEKHMAPARKNGAKRKGGKHTLFVGKKRTG